MIFWNISVFVKVAMYCIELEYAIYHRQLTCGSLIAPY